LEFALGGEWRTARVHDALGRPIDAEWLLLPDGTAVVECAAVIGLAQLDPQELDPLEASSAGLGELIEAALAGEPRTLLVGLGGTATVDGGAGLRSVFRATSIPIRALCDVRNPLLGERGAARVFGPQKGADPATVELLEQRLASLPELEPFRDLPGAGAGGGLGAALAALGAQLVEGSECVLDLIEFDQQALGRALVVTGEGTVDATTFEGKAPGAVLRRCGWIRTRCELFGGVVRDGIDAHALSGEPARAREDLVALGEQLGRALVAAD
jgi:glycerate kinase